MECGVRCGKYFAPVVSRMFFGICTSQLLNGMAEWVRVLHGML